MGLKLENPLKKRILDVPRSCCIHSQSWRRGCAVVYNAVFPISIVLFLQVSLRGEMPNMALLVVLYAMQGVPLGLTLGSM